jgi:predicted nucleic acid-binding protein
VTPIFVDTGYLIGLEASDDQYHITARDYWRSLSIQMPPLITTSYVFDEVVTFFNSRGRHTKAIDLGTRLLDSSLLQLVHVEEDLFKAGWDYLRKRADKRYSLTDCISFVLMQRLGLTEALAFDSHFVQAGFHILPERDT